jgi:hypothetical protein
LRKVPEKSDWKSRLLEDHLALALEVGFQEALRLGHLAEGIQHPLPVMRGAGDVVNRLVERRIGVDVAAERLDDLGHAPFGGAARLLRGRVLEKHVLQEVREARFVGALVAATGPYPPV